MREIDFDARCHHEGRIEADAELADQRGVALAVATASSHEGLGARLGDGAEIVDQLLAAHADAVVGDGQGLGGLVGGEDDASGLHRRSSSSGSAIAA